MKSKEALQFYRKHRRAEPLISALINDKVSLDDAVRDLLVDDILGEIEASFLYDLVGEAKNPHILRLLYGVCKIYPHMKSARLNKVSAPSAELPPYILRNWSLNAKHFITIAIFLDEGPIKTIQVCTKKEYYKVTSTFKLNLNDTGPFYDHKWECFRMTRFGSDDFCSHFSGSEGSPTFLNYNAREILEKVIGFSVTNKGRFVKGKNFNDELMFPVALRGPSAEDLWSQAGFDSGK